MLAREEHRLSVREKDGGWTVEVYDPATKAKRYVGRRKTERAARKLEREALNARDRRRGGGEETVGSFAERWPTDYGPQRGESTRRHNAQQIRPFAREYRARRLRSITRDDAMTWASAHPSTMPALRAMFTDAFSAKLTDENPFARLGLRRSKGREDITVLTRDEVHRLAALAVEVHGEL
jgi:hypothetical protein